LEQAVAAAAAAAAAVVVVVRAVICNDNYSGLRGHILLLEIIGT
jgi:hypothetical protein